MGKDGEKVLADEPFERQMFRQVFLPVGALYVVLLLVSIPQMLRMDPRKVFGLLAFESVLLLVLLGLVLFFLEARQCLVLDPTRRTLTARIVWRGRTLRKSVFGYDEIAALRYGLPPTMQRFLPVAGRRYPLCVVDHKGLSARIFKGPSLPALEELSRRVGEEVGVPWESA